MVHWYTITGLVLSSCLICSTAERLKKCPQSCINIWDCPFYVPFINVRPYPLFFILHLKNNKCGFVDEGKKVPKMCCPEYKPRTDIVNHKNFDLLPTNQCGPTLITGRITGGVYAAPSEFPWMALIAYQTDFPSEYKFKCGGSVINEWYVLTAAHCVEKSLTIEFVRLGEHNIDTEQDCNMIGECEPPVQDLPPSKTITHPRYISETLVNDVALIRLKISADLTQTNVRPICLPYGYLTNVNLENQLVTVTGWGITEKGKVSPILKKASVVVQSKEKCKNIYENILFITRNQICAGGTDGKDSCGGDSGGPLQYVTNLNGAKRFVQEGIVSYGPKQCGLKNKPAIYTDVKVYMKWILDNLEP